MQVFILALTGLMMEMLYIYILWNPGGNQDEIYGGLTKQGLSKTVSLQLLDFGIGLSSVGVNVDFFSDFFPIENPVSVINTDFFDLLQKCDDIDASIISYLNFM